jgi:hypothetical protein
MTLLFIENMQHLLKGSKIGICWLIIVNTVQGKKCQGPLMPKQCVNDFMYYVRY